LIDSLDLLRGLFPIVEVWLHGITRKHSALGELRLLNGG
jgi:hypothetical protein